MTEVRVFVGLGSNLDSPVSHITAAIEELRQHQAIKQLRASSLYHSKPLAEMQQPDYINAVVEFSTELTATSLLSELQTLEDNHSRDRTAIRWGARTLDLDILLYGNEIIETEQLTIPHVGLKERNFVLYPLAELDSNLKLPDNSNLSDLLAACSTEGLVRIE